MRLKLKQWGEVYLLLDNLPNNIPLQKVFLLYVNLYMETLRDTYRIYRAAVFNIEPCDEAYEIQKVEHEGKLTDELMEKYSDVIDEHNAKSTFVLDVLDSEIDIDLPIIPRDYAPSFTNEFTPLATFVEGNDD